MKQTAPGFNGASSAEKRTESSSGPFTDARDIYALVTIHKSCQHPPLMDLERDGNLIEAGVWFLLSMVLLVHAFRSTKQFRLVLFVLVVTLAAFGVSDLVEARTGAWWKPWWLFAWKVACVITLLFGFLRYFKIQKSTRE